jgi:hypothetical protein
MEKDVEMELETNPTPGNTSRFDANHEPGLPVALRRVDGGREPKRRKQDRRSGLASAFMLGEILHYGNQSVDALQLQGVIDGSAEAAHRTMAF